MNHSLYPVVLALGLMAAIRPALSATVYVAATGGDDSRTGLDYWTNAVLTISQGVAKATGFYTDIVLVSNGTYNLAATVNVTNGITVRGFAGREQTFVSGGGNTRCFYLNNGGILDGLTISNGYAATEGGGAYIANTGYVYNCTFTNNIAYNYGGGLYIYTAGLVTNCLFVGNGVTNTVNNYGGGGIFINYGDWIVADCLISNNWAAFSGGGIYVLGANGCRGVVQRCEFVSNQAKGVGGYGGGMFCSIQSSIRNISILDCVFRGNSCFASGGGVYYYSESPTGRVANCLFTENKSTCDSGYGYGAGGGYFGAGVRVQNCVFTKNVAGSRAGAAYLVNNGNSGGEFANCTVVSNRGGFCGGLYLLGPNTVINCIIASNSSPVSNNLYFIDALTTISNSCVPGLSPGGNNITNDPIFVSWTGQNYRLTSGSPCINAGLNEAWMGTAVDFDGLSRIDRFSGKVDMGCYELLPQGTLFNFH